MTKNVFHDRLIPGLAITGIVSMVGMMLLHILNPSWGISPPGRSPVVASPPTPAGMVSGEYLATAERKAALIGYVVGRCNGQPSDVDGIIDQAQAGQTNALTKWVQARFDADKEKAK